MAKYGTRNTGRPPAKGPGPLKSIGRLLFYVIVIGGAAYYYFCIFKPKADARNAYNQAVKEIDGKKFEAAIPLLEKAVKLGKEDKELKPKLDKHLGLAYAGRGLERKKKNDYEGAIEDFKRVVDASDEAAMEKRAHFHLGECYRLRKKSSTSAAIEHMEKAVRDAREMAKKDPTTKMDLSEAELRLKQYGKRARALELATKASKARKAKDMSSAVKYYTELVDDNTLADQVRKARPWYYLATIALDKGDAAEAIRRSYEAAQNAETLKDTKMKTDVRKLQDKIKARFPDEWTADYTKRNG